MSDLDVVSTKKAKISYELVQTSYFLNILTCVSGVEKYSSFYWFRLLHGAQSTMPVTLPHDLSIEKSTNYRITTTTKNRINYAQSGKRVFLK